MTEPEQRHRDEAHRLLLMLGRSLFFDNRMDILANALARAEEDGFEAARETVEDWCEPGEPSYVM